MEKLKVLIVDDASNVLDVVKFGLMSNFANIEIICEYGPSAIQFLPGLPGVFPSTGECGFSAVIR